MKAETKRKLLEAMGLLDIFKKKTGVNPEEYGWVNLHGNYYGKGNGYLLYKSSTGWVLDKRPKHAPGVINRFGEILTEIDIEECNRFAEHVPNPTRRMKENKMRLIAKQITDDLIKELDSPDNKYEPIEMTSVKRKSDGEVFKIGDRAIIYGSNKMFTIGRLTQISDEIIVAEPEYGMIVQNIGNLIKVPEDYVPKGKSKWHDFKK